MYGVFSGLIFTVKQDKAKYGGSFNLGKASELVQTWVNLLITYL